ncbi:hypothetical protein D3C76_1546370 [compost metagenome]
MSSSINFFSNGGFCSRIKPGDRQIGNMLRLNVLDDRAIGSRDHQRHAIAARQVGVQVARRNTLWVWYDLHDVL